MQPINCALGKIEGVVYVCFGLQGQRQPVIEEDKNEASDFIQFVNANDLPSLLSALDLVYDRNPSDYPFFHTEYQTIRSDEKLEEITVKDISDAFQAEKLTRTDKRNIKEAINQWDYSKCTFLRQASYPPSKTPLASLSVVALSDLVKAKNDLCTACHLLAYYFDKCDYEKIGHISIAERDDTSLIGKYYDELAKRTPMFLTTFGSEYAANKYQFSYSDEAGFKTEIEDYLYELFNLMLSDVTMSISPLFYLELLDEEARHPVSSANTVLADMYLYFAKGILKTGAGSIGVCPYCGKLFEKERSTKKYCSQSCCKLDHRYRI